MKNVSDSDATSATQEVVTVAKESAVQVKDAVAVEAGRAMDSIKTAASEQMERGKMELTGSLRSVDEALRRTSAEMVDSPLAPQMEKAADAVATARQFIETHGLEDLGGALRQLSLQHPVVFYSGIFALGFAAGRFLSSTQNRPLERTEVELEINLLDEDLDPTNQTLPNPMVSHYGSY